MIGEETQSEVAATETQETAPEAPATPEKGPQGLEGAQAEPEAPDATPGAPSAEAQQEGTEAPQKGETPAKPPKSEKKFKFKVDGQEREFTESEIHERVNQAELHQKLQATLSQKERKADERLKEAEQLKGSLGRYLNDFRQRGPQSLEDLLAADFGDRDRAQDAVVDMLERYLRPIYQEREQPEEIRQAIRAKRDAERYRERAERLEREAKDREEREAKSREESEKAKRELAFEDEVVKEFGPLKIPNDDITEMIYRKAKKIADESGAPLTPKHYAQMIQARRKELGLDKPLPAAPAQTAPAVSAPVEKTADEIRLENLAKAREKLAQTRKPDKASPAPGFPRAKRGPITTDDVREKLGLG